MLRITSQLCLCVSVKTPPVSWPDDAPGVCPDEIGHDRRRRPLLRSRAVLRVSAISLRLWCGFSECESPVLTHMLQVSRPLPLWIRGRTALVSGTKGKPHQETAASTAQPRNRFGIMGFGAGLAFAFSGGLDSPEPLKWETCSPRLGLLSHLLHNDPRRHP